ncbi:unnamed protein product [Protopolystoma xenopodis]|uniref:Uncharacterized protein n=1 Tax=Protopolystoma xenopodis TaxID=117903 RepID=A0A3S5CHZ4_9PLAT|nr:unnamed protein product [Protopolystoma xenopodis]
MFQRTNWFTSSEGVVFRACKPTELANLAIWRQVNPSHYIINMAELPSAQFHSSSRLGFAMAGERSLGRFTVKNGKFLFANNHQLRRKMRQSAQFPLVALPVEWCTRGRTIWHSATVNEDGDAW